jgi:hypothetical protein
MPSLSLSLSLRTRRRHIHHSESTFRLFLFSFPFCLSFSLSLSLFLLVRQLGLGKKDYRSRRAVRRFFWFRAAKTFTRPGGWQVGGEGEESEKQTANSSRRSPHSRKPSRNFLNRFRNNLCTDQYLHVASDPRATISRLPRYSTCASVTHVLSRRSSSHRSAK